MNQATKQITDSGPAGGQTPGQWQARWRRARGASLLRQSQQASEEKWRAFYGQVSRLYAGVAGHDGRMGGQVAGLLRREGLIGPGLTLLDVGCGSGALALAAARAGARVTALDESRPMLNALAGQATRQGVEGLELVCAPWDGLPGRPVHDLALASFFPPALCVAGLLRLESLARQSCALVLGTGREALPFRRRIWEAVLGRPYPRGGFHLECASGWLCAAGRRPRVRPLSWPVQFRQPLDRVLRFYQSYFAIFDCDPRAVEQAVRRELAGWSSGGVVRALGREEVAVLCWSPRPGAAPAAGNRAKGGGAWAAA